MQTNCFLDVALIECDAAIEKLGDMHALDVQQLRHDARRVDILELQVRLIQRFAVQIPDDVARNEVGGARGEMRKNCGEILLRRDVIFGFFVANGLPLFREAPVNGALVVVVLLNELQKARNIDEHVVVGLEEERHARTVGVDPLERRNCLERQIVIAIYKVAAHEVIVHVLLGRERIFVRLVFSLSENEADCDVAPRPIVTPALSDGKSLLVVRRRRHN